MSRSISSGDARSSHDLQLHDRRPSETPGRHHDAHLSGRLSQRHDLCLQIRREERPAHPARIQGLWHFLRRPSVSRQQFWFDFWHGDWLVVGPPAQLSVGRRRRLRRVGRQSPADWTLLRPAAQRGHLLDRASPPCHVHDAQTDGRLAEPRISGKVRIQRDFRQTRSDNFFIPPVFLFPTFTGIFLFVFSFVDFISREDSKHDRGSECDQTILSRKGSSAVVYSPNYPFPYSPGIVCKYNVYGLQDEQHFERIRLDFEKFDIPSADNTSVESFQFRFGKN